jgi:hypothetical protein
MTAIIVSEIPPAALETVERAAIYFNSILYDLYGGTRYQEVSGDVLTPLVTAQQGRAGDGTERLIYRPALQLQPDWRTSTNPIWLDSVPFGDVAVPARYLV